MSRASSKLGFHYFVTFVAWLYLIKDRSEWFSIFCVPARILRSDNASSYFSAPFDYIYD